MLKRMGVDDPAKVTSLRYRGHGWPGRATVSFRTDGRIETHDLSYEQSWGEVLQKYRQWRCYICPDHSGEFADAVASTVMNTAPATAKIHHATRIHFGGDKPTAASAASAARGSIKPEALSRALTA
ncbi:MAG TPA: Coenzyme F420 hydrogenase/dehydrogenase, beta subunit C-terminal domain, partial [Casimicrobium sp.]|nr:Coenzyme F420 hydrogenase/dehydrogenase, beta subunit C-terminal domain [Casimicrobium sp.]